MVNVIEDKLIIRKAASKEELEELYDLRWKLLRKPWNQPKGSERDEKEDESYSFIAILDDKIVGTARLHKNNEKEGQIRYLAVEKEYQKMGIGKKLMKNIEMHSINLGLESIILNARKTAEDFFEKLGYEVIRKGHTLFNEIEHFVMRKSLINAN